MATIVENERPGPSGSGHPPSSKPSVSSGRTAALVKRLALAIVAIGVFAALAYGSSRLFIPATGSDGVSMSTYTVKPGELLITVTEDGTVESATNLDVKCQVAGGSSILWIVEDGKEVKKGDKLVELDAAVLEDQINTQKITYNKARSLVIQAQKNYDVAKISVEEYIEGTFKKELQDAETLITIAEENLRSAKNSLEYSERMFQRGYISSLELESQQFTVQRAQLELDSANTAKNVLVKFTKLKMLEDLNSQVETANATMESEQAAFALEESNLKRLETQLANCTIIAPQDGMVVYANERGGRFGQQSSAIEEGAAVRDRQTILRLPELSQMQVKVTVHETKVEDIRRGMRTRINIQGRELQGNVTSIANQHEQASFFGGNIKEYATIVKIDGEVNGLKPGMTAEAEILVAHLQNVLTLPISAVVELRGKFHCWVKKPDGGIDRRDLVLGLSNDRFVEVKEGIAEGDQVVRNPRALVDASLERNIVIEDVNVTEKFGEATLPQPGPAEGGGGGGPSDARGRGGPDGGRRGPGGGGPEGGSMDLMQFDSDGDGKVSKDEAPEQMQSFFDRLDGNGDGFIDQEEIDAMRRRFESRGGPGEGDGGSGRGPGDGGGRGPGGGGESGDGPESGRRGGGGRSRDLMQYDTDGDGKVSMDEVPEAMKGFFDRMDGNGDGFIDADEIQEMRSRFSGGGGGPRGGE